MRQGPWGKKRNLGDGRHMVSLLQQITLIQQYGNVLDRGGRGTGEHEKIAWLIEEKIRMGH
jgi:hypothetical protein